MSKYLELVEVSEGVIVLRRSDNKNSPLVKIEFSEEVKKLLNGMEFDVAKEMIKSGIESLNADINLDNLDEDLFENPDKFDVTRKNARRHIAFGQGIHVCLGMNLARKEMYTAFPIILDRLKNMRFSEGNNFVYSPNVLLRGLDNLYIEFDQV